LSVQRKKAVDLEKKIIENIHSGTIGEELIKLTNLMKSKEKEN